MYREKYNIIVIKVVAVRVEVIVAVIAVVILVGNRGYTGCPGYYTAHWVRAAYQI